MTLLALGAGLAVDAFTPASLAPFLWYDPSDLSSMFQTTDTSTPAVVDGPIGRINDKSGNGAHLVQPTPATCPTLRQVGAVFWLEFGGSHYMGANIPTFPQPFTAFVAGAISGAAVAQWFLDGTVTATRLIMGYNNTGVDLYAGAEILGSEALPVGDGVWSGKVNGATSLLRRDTVQTAAGNAGANSFAAGITVGHSTLSAAVYLTGKIHGLILLPGTPDPLATEKWLGAKQGRAL